MSKSLFGYGLTTKALAEFEQNGEIWDIFDDRFNQVHKDEFGNNLMPPSYFIPKESILEIPSPGFPKNHPLVKASRHLISEYDYFNNIPAVKIWISGTNGKTTTTQMTQHLLSDFGSCMGANVGVPLAKMDKKAKIWILETSSFTIHYTKIATPKIYALLPVTVDHLSWHGDMKDYEDTKIKPLKHMSQGSIAIIPQKYKDVDTKAKLITYSNEDDLAKFCGISIDSLKFKPPFLLDALIALSIEKIIFDMASVEKINQFVIEKNKLEEILDSKGRVWVNDTKATNIDACIQAVKRYKDKTMHLILGGDDKGVDLKGLFDQFCNYKIMIYAIGSNSDKIEQLCKKYNIVCKNCKFLKVAIKDISEVLNLSEIALLSPACASLDQYSSYIQRGEEFCNLVGNI